MLPRQSRSLELREATTTRRRHAFTLVELLTVIGVIAFLVAMLLPVLSKARQQAILTKCASNLRQITTALHVYADANRGVMFWRGANPSLDGMDWYVYGGRVAGNTNTGQAGLFNRFDPRPLNPYVGKGIEVFKCPADDAMSSFWTDGVPHWEWVGTSYNFNALGNPFAAYHHQPDNRAGLSGKKIGSIPGSSETVVLLDACLVYPGNWHNNDSGNIAFLDAHVERRDRPTADGSDRLLWAE
jgi:prepilin-type processing-associated H-X9-DG protein